MSRATRSRLGVVLTGLMGLAVTWSVAGRIDADRDRAAQDRFEHASTVLADDLVDEVDRYQALLRSAAQFVAVADPVSDAEFDAWSQRGLLDDLAGLRGISFVSYVRAADLGAFVAAQRADGDAGFDVRTLASGPDYFVISSNAPASSAGEGTDLGGAVERREAFERARDTGEPAITDAFYLVADQDVPVAERQLAFAIYAPAYRAGMPLDTVEQRRAALLGFAATAVRGQEFIESIGLDHDGVGLALFDGITTSAARALGSSHPGEDGGGLRRLVPVDLDGHRWTMVAAALPAFTDGNATTTVEIVSTGLVITALLVLALHLLLSRRRHLQLDLARAAAAWRLERDRKHQIFDTVQEGLVLQDAAGAILEWNPATERILGLSGDQLAGRTAYDRGWGAERPDGTPMPPEEHPSVIARATGEAVTDRLVGMRRADGSLAWVVVNAHPLLDDAGEVAGVVVSFVDVTARKVVEAERQASEARFRAAFEGAAVGMALLADDGTVVEANDAYLAMVRCDGAHLVGHRAVEVVDPDDDVLGGLALDELRSGGRERIVGKLRFVRGDGEVGWGRFSTSRIEVPSDGATFVLQAEDVTESHHAGEALRASEATRRASLDALEQGVALSDMEGRVLMLNGAGERILGFDAEELTERVRTGRWITYREDGSILPAEERPIRRAMSGEGSATDAVVVWRNRDDEPLVLRVTTRPVLDDADRITGVVTAFTDITVERAAEVRRAETEEQLRRAFDDAVTGMALVGLDGRYLRVNDAHCRMLGYTADDLVGRSTFDLAHPDDLIEARAMAGRVVRGELDSCHLELRLRRVDGSHMWARLALGIAVDGRGVAQHLACHVEDITDQRAAAESLRATQARFTALVERSSDVIWVISDEGVLTYASPAGERLLGGGPGSQTGRTFAELLHPSDLEPAAELLASLRRIPGATGSIQARLETAAGEWRQVEIVATNRLDDPDVAGIVANVRDVTERAEAAARLAWQAFHDPLTGLPNRALLLDRLDSALARAEREHERVALLFIDLDRFKIVNDTHGHAIGDLLLVEVADRLADVVRATDTVARLGGDEFIVLADSLTDAGDATALAARINERLTAPFLLAGTSIRVSASIGVAFDVDHRPGSLLRDADNALYRAKERGKNRFEVFDDGLRAEAIHRVRTEQVLRRAVDEAGLTVHYQPIVDLTTGALVATEALLRFPGRNGELVSPADFIPVAEETGLIVTIGAGVLDDACQRLVDWRSELGDDAPHQVAVNVSARQLAAPGFVELVGRTLERHRLRPADLTIEFTESTIISADRTTTLAVAGLHELGVSLAVDDFGTGYSSLSYLKRFPVDAVKLDRSFVDGLGTDPSDTAIVKAVISLGHSLGLVTIAEGIETPEQLEALRDLGCDLGQGFHLGRPASPGALRAFRPPMLPVRFR